MNLSLKKTLLYLPVEIVSKIMVEAANHDQMHYSSLINNWISEAISDIADIKDYAELKSLEKYSEIFNSFSPSKRGRPWNKKSVVKKSITVYLSVAICKNITKFSDKFDLSKSSFVELALLIADKKLHIGFPSFKHHKIRLYDFDYDLLIKLMEMSGTNNVSAFLAACQMPSILKLIKEEIKSQKFFQI